jgi:hypothetical protein
MFYMGTFIGLYVASTYKVISSLDDSTLTITGALGSIFNGSSRIFWSTLQDKFGFKKVYFCLLCI